MPNFKVEMQQQPISESLLKVGNKVTFTNEYGVAFSGHTIQGFPTDKEYAYKAYIDSDCYWCAKPFNSLTLEEKPNYLFFEHYELSVSHLIDRAIAYSKPISQSDFEQSVSNQALERARARVAASYARLECFDLVEATRTWVFTNPRIGISDGSLGRHQNLTLLVELGDELLAFDAGKAWNDTVIT